MTNSDVKVNGLPKSFEDILQDWIVINKEYLDKYYPNFKYDCLYHSSERASVSSLAGAIWRLGGIVSEAFPCGKKKINSRNKCATNIGRMDLWFTRKKTQYLAEAKQIWPKLTINCESLGQKIENSMQAACDQFSCYELTKDDYKARHLGLVFVVPSLSEYRGRQLLEEGEICEEFIGYIKNPKFDFYAYFTHANKVVEADGRLYFGAAIVGKVIR